MGLPSTEVSYTLGIGKSVCGGSPPPRLLRVEVRRTRRNLKSCWGSLPATRPGQTNVFGSGGPGFVATENRGRRGPGSGGRRRSATGTGGDASIALRNGSGMKPGYVNVVSRWLLPHLSVFCSCVILLSFTSYPFITRCCGEALPI